jgi:hypothetical protein
MSSEIILSEAYNNYDNDFQLVNFHIITKNFISLF